MNGSEVCKAIRKAHVTTPILVLSGTTESANKATLLNLGADDYVNKPFDATELAARLRALRRRGHHFDSGISTLLKIDDLVLDPISRTVTRGGKPIDLRRKEFDILEYLIAGDIGRWRYFLRFQRQHGDAEAGSARSRKPRWPSTTRRTTARSRSSRST